jgi:hypothetical protein
VCGPGCRSGSSLYIYRVYLLTPVRTAARSVQTARRLDEMQTDMTVHEQKQDGGPGYSPSASSFRGVTRLSEVSARTEPPGRHRLFLGIRHLKPTVVVCDLWSCCTWQATAPVCSKAFCCDRPCLLRYGSSYIVRFCDLDTPCGVLAPSARRGSKPQTLALGCRVCLSPV